MTHAIRLLSLLLLPIAASCDDRGDDATDATDATDGTDDTDEVTLGPVPMVLSNEPLDGAADVPLNASLRVTFSELMDPATLADSFQLSLTTQPTSVDGRVIVADGTAVFWPASHLSANTEYIATITTDATSAEGVALDEDHSWTFQTGATLEPGLPVNLGTAGDYVILAKTGISTVPESAVTGDMAVSPAAATYITGFSLTADPTETFSTSTQVTGKVFAANYAVPTPSVLTTAVSDMLLAFTDAAGRAPDVTELGGGNIGGMTLEPGVYAWGTGLLIPTDVTLSGSSTDVWIFQIAQGLTLESGVNVRLTGGAVPENVFWQVAGRVELATTTKLPGIVLSQTAITLRTGASVQGRLLAQTAVELDGSTVVEPAQ